MKMPRALAVVVSCLLAGRAPVVLADPDEAWLERAALPEDVAPLLVWMVDTSAAAQRPIRVRPAYDPARIYADATSPDRRCESGRVYWRRGPGPAPDCSRQRPLSLTPTSPATGLHCEDARPRLARQGFYVASRAAQWRADGAAGTWSAPAAASDAALECRGDRARHGTGPGAWYAADGARGPWSGHAVDEIDWNRAPHADPYTFFLGNYLNYLRADLPAVEVPAAQFARREIGAVLAATEGLEAALWLLPPEGAAPDGGYLAIAPAPAQAVAGSIDRALARPAGAASPLAEWLTEAAAWLAGAAPRFGNVDSADASALDRTAGRYRSPFIHACRPVTVALVTAGYPSQDDAAAQAAAALPGFPRDAGDCAGACLAAVARWISGSDLSASTPGIQSAAVHWLLAPAAATEALEAAGADARALGDPRPFIDAAAGGLQRDAAVPARPRLSAPGFLPPPDPGQAPGVVYGMTAARPAQRWLGNLFRYGLRVASTPLSPPEIVDRDGEPAIDTASGLPRPASRSGWSVAPDADLLRGGAAGRLPPADARRIYSDLASGELAQPANRLGPGDARIDRDALGLGADDPETVDEVLEWLQSQRLLGDPGRNPPLIVHYGSPGPRLVFVGGQDGLLQAFDADSGAERWAFMPRALLPRLPALRREAGSVVRTHGIDSPLALHRHDPDGDGVIDAARGEHLWLFFGLGRGGNAYYALDIARPDEPRLLWSAALPAGAAVQAHAEPVVVRLAVAGAGQSAGDWAVLLAGGYDPRFDTLEPEDGGSGSTLSLVDAETGRRLWSAGTDALADVAMPDWRAASPSAPRALDADGDGRMDRAYLLDLAGSLWRFDFRDGATAGELARGRRLARLGDGSQRFHASPDLAVVRLAGRDRLAIAAASGWAARPRDLTLQDRVYVLIERDDASVLSESDLHDATESPDPMPPDAAGWYLRLGRHGPGEKAIGAPVTFDHALRFQTYQPLPADDAAPCGPPRAVHRLHARDIRSGLPRSAVGGRDDGIELETEAQGLPVSLRFAFPEWPAAPCPGCAARPFGLAGIHLFDAGYAGDPVRTSWRKLAPTADSR